MSIFDSMRINSSGLALERLKMDTVSTNIANVNTTRTNEGGPYRKKTITFEESISREKNFKTGLRDNKSYGVKVIGIEESEEEFKRIYDPEHPDSDEEGYLLTSNVNMVDEMIDLIKIQRAYEGNVTALNTSKAILKKALEISKD